MDKETYSQIEEYLTDKLKRKPTEEEITNEYNSVCEWAFEQHQERLMDF